MPLWKHCKSVKMPQDHCFEHFVCSWSDHGHGYSYSDAVRDGHDHIIVNSHGGWGSQSVNQQSKQGKKSYRAAKEQFEFKGQYFYIPIAYILLKLFHKMFFCNLMKGQICEPNLAINLLSIEKVLVINEILMQPNLSLSPLGLNFGNHRSSHTSHLSQPSQLLVV